MNKPELVAHCMAKPGVQEDYPFGPDTQVFKVIGKVFALTDAGNHAETVNLKCDPEHAILLRQTYPKDVLPGYHMNKRHWNTVTLAGAVPDDLLLELIDESYDLVVASLKKSERDQLRGMP